MKKTMSKTEEFIVKFLKGVSSIKIIGFPLVVILGAIVITACLIWDAVLLILYLITKFFSTSIGKIIITTVLAMIIYKIFF